MSALIPTIIVFGFILFVLAVLLALSLCFVSSEADRERMASLLNYERLGSGKGLFENTDVAKTS